VADDLTLETLAVAREAADRLLGLRPFDVQLVGALGLWRGRVVQMDTGEGKTLVAALAATLGAPSGDALHVLTVNDYLARRDAAWMGPLLELFDLRVAALQAGMSGAERRQAYAADVTYLTAREAGFDYLRDGLCRSAGERRQRGLRRAIVDEADSIMIDQARIPLVVAGPGDQEATAPQTLARLARALQPGADYDIAPAGHGVILSDTGVERVERELGCGPLHDPERSETLQALHAALHAQVVLRRDVDYIVRGGRVELVDALTGRVATDRHWPDLLQAAVEAKEGLRHDKEGRVLASIPLQHFLGLYDELAGMTATALPQDTELFERYGTPTLVLPPHRACRRRDLPDRIFNHHEAKLNALQAEIAQTHATGRPVLVGTASVRESEELAGRLEGAGLPCRVLNARTDELEASIIAEAGALGAVTISTNMAGRGTDIRLGGADGSSASEVRALGGLYVLGTCRHESRRIDRQLRGRAGRQGDPGESRLYVSLDDALLAERGVAKRVPGWMSRPSSEPLQGALAHHHVEQAQASAEGLNSEVRRSLWRYSAVVEQQRLLVRQRRDELLDADPEGLPLDAQVELACLDAAWTEHLAHLDAVREGVHMVGLGGRDPLQEFARQAHAAFSALQDNVEEQVASHLTAAKAGAQPSPALPALPPPEATWTYLRDDDAFERSQRSLLTGLDVGRSVGAAFLGPIFMIGALLHRLVGGRRSGR